MDFFSDVYGNRKQKAYFSSLIREGRYAHAYILEAPQGGGKKTFARALTATLAASAESERGEETAKKCRRILEGNSPDVTMLQREDGKKTVGVDRVRDFCDTVFLTPSELNFKMYIFDEADCITPQAQNALLKIIEEPPAGVYMLLLCENSLSLLSTVRSRAQKISLERFDGQALLAYAQRTGLSEGADAEKLAFAVRMSGGSIGRFQTLLDEESLAFSVYSMTKRIIEGQAAKNRSVSYFDFLKQITDFVTTREILDALTSDLLLAYGDLARVKSAEESASLFFEREEAEALSMQFAMESVARSFAAADAIRSDMRFNTGVAVTAALLALELWSAV